MPRSPYRSADVLPSKEGSPLSQPLVGGDIIFMLSLLWIVSVGRVFWSIQRGEVAGAEVTLAGLCVALLPILLARSIAARWSRRA